MRIDDAVLHFKLANHKNVCLCLDVGIDMLREKADAVYNQLKSDLHSKTHELSIVQNKASILKVI